MSKIRNCSSFEKLLYCACKVLNEYICNRSCFLIMAEHGESGIIQPINCYRIKRNVIYWQLKYNTRFYYIFTIYKKIKALFSFIKNDKLNSSERDIFLTRIERRSVVWQGGEVGARAPVRRPCAHKHKIFAIIYFISCFQAKIRIKIY